jgi:hypothetical protein
MSLQSLRNLSRKLFREVEWATALEAKIEAAKSRPLESFVGGHAGFILQVLHIASIREMIMTACRLFDEGAANRESLTKAFHLLRKPEVRAELTRLEGRRLQFQEGKDVAEQVAALELKWKALRKKNSGAIERLRSARDTTLAHILDTSPSRTPIYKDLFDVLAAARDVVGDFALIVGTNTNGFGAAQLVWKRRADEYWEVLIAGAKAVQRKARLKEARKQTRARISRSHKPRS